MADVALTPGNPRRWQAQRPCRGRAIFGRPVGCLSPRGQRHGAQANCAALAWPRAPGLGAAVPSVIPTVLPGDHVAPTHGPNGGVASTRRGLPTPDNNGHPEVEMPSHIPAVPSGRGPWPTSSSAIPRQGAPRRPSLQAPLSNRSPPFSRLSYLVFRVGRTLILYFFAS
jgi:hypothetical protein